MKRNNYTVTVTEKKVASGFTTLAEAQAWIARKVRAGDTWIVTDKAGLICGQLALYTRLGTTPAYYDCERNATTGGREDEDRQTSAGDGGV